MLVASMTFERLRELIRARLGLHFDDRKLQDLDMHLSAALKEAQISNLDVYYARLLKDANNSSLWLALTRRLTIGETYFFRDSAQMLALRDYILPELIERHQSQRMLRLWSAGCATGEEPYTLAILLRELIPDIETWSIFILATDINRESLDFATKAIYRERSFRNETPGYIRERYFKPSVQGYELLPEIRRMVHFAHLNLAEDNYPSPATFTSGLDLVICRNVTIYFHLETTRLVVQRFRRAVVDEGWLVVGHAEPMMHLYEGFEARNFPNAIAYQKVLANPIKPHAIAPVAPLPEPAPIAPAPIPQKPLPEPQTARSCYEKGKRLADQMQWGEAHQWLTRALSYNPLMLEAYFTRALIYMHTGESAAALQVLRQAVYIDHNFALGHFNIGLLYWRMGNVKEAKLAWRATQELLRHYALDEELPYGDGITAQYILTTMNNYLLSAS